uniref:Lipocalin n=1 Tax=Rhipicephalus zambeziensis TaxID=60191 RepID=A0A224YNJ4_9ACAR
MQRQDNSSCLLWEQDGTLSKPREICLGEFETHCKNYYAGKTYKYRQEKCNARSSEEKGQEAHLLQGCAVVTVDISGFL